MQKFEHMMYRVYDLVDNRYRDDEGDYFVVSEDGRLFVSNDYEGEQKPGEIFTMSIVDPERFLLERCTGETDDNGILIYQGDIVEEQACKNVGVVDFEHGKFQIEFKSYDVEIHDVKINDGLIVINNVHNKS